MQSACADGSFYLAFAGNLNASAPPSDAQLDYNNLPPVFSADGTNVSRAAFEADANAELCDDPCQPVSGGRTCRALSCYEVMMGGQGQALGMSIVGKMSGLAKAASLVEEILLWAAESCQRRLARGVL